MFFHGIRLKYLLDQFPFLSPDSNVSNKRETQLKDRQHLIEKFGLEPIHMLESTAYYPIRTCLKECFSFGNIVLCYKSLPQPYWQISKHEIGVVFLDVREVHCFFTKSLQTHKELNEFLPDKFKSRVLKVKL